MSQELQDDRSGDPTAGGEAAYFPLKFFVDFLEFLMDNRKRVEIITYHDLAWEQDFDYIRNYPNEKRQWKERRARGDIDPEKIHVLLQHDVDTRPERTLALLRHEEQLGITSNIMIFNRRVDRRHLRDHGELRFTPYEIDLDYLRRLEGRGFVVGYHSNAYEQAHFDLAQAEAIFARDVAELSRHFDLRFFSAHGGTPGPGNLNNRDVPFPAFLQTSLRWVHNGHTPWFTATFSDGGINSPRRDPARRDMRDFVKTWRPGERYRILTHPQYYHDPCSVSPRLAGTPWYEEVRAFYARGQTGSLWEGLHPDFLLARRWAAWRRNWRTGMNRLVR